MKIQYPLREKRKKKIRSDLMLAAVELFADKGYEQTTLAEVADQAGTHVQTLYRHFPTKADFVAEAWHESLIKFETFFSARTCDSLTAWRNWIELQAIELTREGNAKYRKRQTFFWQIPYVSSKTFDFWFRYQEVLAEGIADDMGVDVADSPLPMLIAAMLWGGNSNTARRWVMSGTNSNFSEAILEVVDTVIDQFQHLLKT